MSDASFSSPAEPLDVLQILWRSKWSLFGALLLGALVGLGWSAIQSKTYVGEAELILTDPLISSALTNEQTSNFNVRYVRAQADYIESDLVAARAADKLGGAATATDVAESVSARSEIDRDVVTINARRPTAAEAAAYANAVGEAYGELVAEGERQKANLAIAELEGAARELEAQIESLEAELAADSDDPALQAVRDGAIVQLVSLRSRIEQITVNSALYGSGIQLFQPASPPQAPAKPRPLRNTVIAAFFSTMIAALAVVWRKVRSPRAEEPGDPAPVLGAPWLGSVPTLPGIGRGTPLPNAAEPRTLAAEAFQFILTSLDFALDGKPARSFVVTSASPGDGKTLTAASLAMAAAADGRRPLLVDADERERGLSMLVGTVNRNGLTDLARSSEANLHDFTHVWRPAPNVEVAMLAAGHRPADTVSFFRSPGFEHAMREITREYDLVLLDSPPVLAVPDTSEIAAEADAVILVVDRGTPLRVLKAAAERLAAARTPLLGYIFNRAAGPHGGYGYGYGYDHHGAGYKKLLRWNGKRGNDHMPPAPISGEAELDGPASQADARQDAPASAATDPGTS